MGVKRDKKEKGGEGGCGQVRGAEGVGAKKMVGSLLSKVQKAVLHHILQL